MAWFVAHEAHGLVWQCASYLAINLSTIIHECRDSYSAPAAGFTGEGALLN